MADRSRGAHLYDITVSSALSAAALNLAAGMVDAPQALAGVPALFSCFAATLAIVLVALSAVTLIVSLVIRSLPLSSFRFTLTLASNTIMVAALLPVLPSLLQADRFLAQAILVVILGLLFGGSFLLTYRALATDAGRRFTAKHLTLVLMVAPIPALAVAGLAWVRSYVSGGAHSGAFVLAAGAILFMGSVIMVPLYLFRRRLRPAAVLTALLAAALLSPYLTAGYIRLTATRPPTPGDGALDARPAVILLTVDTLRADFVSYYNQNAERTEAIDSLLNDSVVFLNARSAASWTKPSMAAIHTGLSPLITQVSTREASLPGEFLTLSEILRQNGYSTAAIGRNPYLTRSFNFQQGFDQYLVYPLPSLGESLGAWILPLISEDPRYVVKPSTETLTDLSIDWLTRHRGAPFFLWVHYLDPHLPYAPPSSYIPPPSDSGRVTDVFSDISGVRTGKFVPDAAEKAKIRVLYSAEIQYVDDNVSRLLETLRRLGLYSSSLIIFASDHGEEFWEHNGYEHGHTLYDEVLRVPLALKLPSASDKGPRTALVSNSQIMATILDLLHMGNALPPFANRSLPGSWSDGGEPRSSCEVMSAGLLYYDQGIALICGEEKYVVFPSLGKELYFDLAVDPSESQPCAGPLPERLSFLRDAVQSQMSQAAVARRQLGVSSGSVDSLEDSLLHELRSLGYVN